MVFLKKMLWLLKWVTIFGLLAWLFNDPVPENFSAPLTLRIQMAVQKIGQSAVWLTSEVGITNYEYTLRKLIETLVRRRASTDIPDNITVVDDLFDGVKVRVYRPSETSPSETGYRGLVFFHGGGWFLGSLNQYHPLMLSIVNKVDVVVVSVDYRLAPEHIYPAGLNDCMAATKFFVDNSDKFGVDRQRISVGGDSAGGNLAAAVTLKLRDKGYPWMPRNQLLIYPTLQCMDFTLPSFQQNYYGPMFKTRQMAMACAVYATGSREYTDSFLNGYHTTSEVKKQLSTTSLRHEDLPQDHFYEPYRKPKMDHGDARLWERLGPVLSDPYFAPLLAEDFSGLPSAYIYTGQYDMLRDDAWLYAKKLRDAGANVSHIHVANSFHSACSQRRYKEGTECVSLLVQYIDEYC